MRTYSTSHSLADGFRFHIQERPWRVALAVELADLACRATGHRFCNSGPIGAVFDWEFRATKTLASVSIDRATADAVSWHEGDWAYLDDEEAS